MPIGGLVIMVEIEQIKFLLKIKHPNLIFARNHLQLPDSAMCSIMAVTTHGRYLGRTDQTNNELAAWQLALEQVWT